MYRWTIRIYNSSGIAWKLGVVRGKLFRCGSAGPCLRVVIFAVPVSRLLCYVIRLIMSIASLASDTCVALGGVIPAEVLRDWGELNQGQLTCCALV